jgi:hypothetical protein
MKTKFFLAIALPIAAIIAIMACTKDANETNEIKNKDNLLTLKSFERYGQIHNEILTKVKNDYVIPEEITDYDEAINHVNDFIKKSFLENKLFSNDENIKLADETNFDKCKYFVDTRIFVAKMFADKQYLQLMSANENGFDNINNDTTNFNIYEKLDESFALALIDSFEHDKLKIIAKNIEAIVGGKINDSDFYDCIVDIAGQWDAQGYAEDSQFGKALGITLAIGIASHEWWEENPDARLVHDTSEIMELQVHPAALDAAGALIGAAKALLSGGDAIGEGLVGAVIGSVGTLTKVGQFFQEVWSWFF